MGIELPATTKMSAALLSKRLDRALDAAQCFTQVFPDHSEGDINASGEGGKTKAIDFASLPIWTGERLGLGRKSMKESIGLEDIERKERERMTGKTETPPNLDPFYTFRTLVHALGQDVDGGSKEAMFENAELSHALFIKVAEIRKADDTTPVLLLQFRLDAKPSEGDYAFWKYASTNRLKGLRCPNRSLNLLHRLLLLNSDRVASGAGAGDRNASLKTSFILPIGPIEKFDIARLTRGLSCVLCGKQSKTRCARCQATPYCS